MTITASQFRLAVGREPINDDLERCNCDQHDPKDRTNTHWMCGWDVRRGMPRFVPGQSKAVRYRFVASAERYELVHMQVGKPCRNHSTVINQAGKEFVVHDSELMNPFNRIQIHHHPHYEEME